MIITSMPNDLKIAKGVEYTTTVPTEANTEGGLKFVVVNSVPSTKYAGWFYIITA